MSVTLELIPQLVEKSQQGVRYSEAEWESAHSAAYQHCFVCPSIGQQQIGGLVRQLFLEGDKKKRRQVLFSSVDKDVEIASLCMMVGKTLEVQDLGNACVVEAVPSWAEQPRAIDDSVSPQPRFGVLRDAAQQLSDRLWFMPSEVLREGGRRKWSTSWIRGRLAELRLDFDYTVLQGPPAGSDEEACLLARLCDGIVLVVRANSTRRLVAQQVIEKLQTAHIRILGAVMTERTFPIPEAIYRRL